jgi:2-dehydro-3-deoxygalactonokinase
MIGVDWGISSLRAYRLRDGRVVARRERSAGILTVSGGRFAETLHEVVGEWLSDGEDRVLLSGMIGSRQGWKESGTVACPAGLTDLAGALSTVPFGEAAVRIVPGVAGADDAGIPEIMRGEETQIIGAGLGTGVACLPGSHSKWARVADGRIAGFTTYLSGETFAAIRDHTILARQIHADDGHRRDVPPCDAPAFDAGVARSAEPGGLLHHLFGVRSLGLAGLMADGEAALYLSGLVIGHEVRAALSPGETVWVIGSPSLSALYTRAITACGGTARLADADAAALGLGMIAGRATWS